MYLALMSQNAKPLSLHVFEVYAEGDCPVEGDDGLLFSSPCCLQLMTSAFSTCALSQQERQCDREYPA
ncbi:hypothetical protein KSD_00940 [Ktedonobacter sp. SOSP1-85]|nr:hypothetical protein KSD_00940 [Ktedonobacter sp. SOSP1-85]